MNKTLNALQCRIYGMMFTHLTSHSKTTGPSCNIGAHLRLKQAEPQMCHSPKDEDGVENQITYDVIL